MRIRKYGRQVRIISSASLPFDLLSLILSSLSNQVLIDFGKEMFSFLKNQWPFAESCSFKMGRCENKRFVTLRDHALSRPSPYTVVGQSRHSLHRFPISQRKMAVVLIPSNVLPFIWSYHFLPCYWLDESKSNILKNEVTQLALSKSPPPFFFTSLFVAYTYGFPEIKKLLSSPYTRSWKRIIYLFFFG